MTKTTTNLLLMLITILAGTYFYITCCSECGANVEEEPPKEAVMPNAPKATSYPFAFGDGDYAYNVNDNFNFNVSSSDYLEPLSQKVRDGIIPGLKNYLTQNENKTIDITGYYTSDEKNNSAYPNLGLARANAVKNYFVSQEIPSVQINTMGRLMDEMVPKEAIFLGPVSYRINEAAINTADEIEALYNKIKDDPLILNFDTGQASINLTAKQRQKVADISRYLDKVEKAKCEVIGYTDNEGSRKTNMKLGQERADFIKDYLMRNGILEDRIKTRFKGSKDPIATNDTEEGRAKNRRTVISIK